MTKLQTITFKRLSPSAKLPTRNNASDAGLDLIANEGVEIESLKESRVNNRATVGTGIAVEIPEGYYGRIAPRSGLAAKKGIDVLAGVCDASYRGEIKVVLINFGANSFHIAPGDKIAQLIISPIVTPTAVWGELTESERGDKGFGSSGR